MIFEINKLKGFKSLGKNKNKEQIVLCHSSRNINDYILSLKHRFNGKSKRIPNYIIDTDGKIFQLISDNEYSDFLDDNNINKKSIIVLLENLGWLEKEPLTNQYINWIGDIYKGEVYEKKWRDYFFWHPYSENQLNMTVNLCMKLCEENSIYRKFVGHNTKINGIEKFKGVSTRSNYSINYTDISPAFNFELFLKKIENE